LLRRSADRTAATAPSNPSLVAAVERGAARSSPEPGRASLRDRAPSPAPPPRAAPGAGTAATRRRRDWRRSQVASRHGARIGEAIVDRPRYPGSGQDCFDRSGARTKRSRPFNPSLVAAVERVATRSSPEPGPASLRDRAPPPRAARGAGTAATKGWRALAPPQVARPGRGRIGEAILDGPPYRGSGQDCFEEAARGRSAAAGSTPSLVAAVKRSRRPAAVAACRRQSALGDPHRQSSSVR